MQISRQTLFAIEHELAVMIDVLRFLDLITNLDSAEARALLLPAHGLLGDRINDALRHLQAGQQGAMQ